jgi:putative lipoic acid-binding regulatory protein
MILGSNNQPPGTPEKPEIEYPCIWVYKVIGEDCTLLKDIIVSTCAPQEVIITHSHTSSKGKYHSLNAELVVEDEEARLGIYKALKSHPAVKIIL